MTTTIRLADDGIQGGGLDRLDPILLLIPFGLAAGLLRSELRLPPAICGLVSMVQLLTIVTEAALEGHLVQDFDRLGAHGWTVADARGRGSRGVRDSA